MDTLLFFQSTSTTSARLKTEGVYAGARAHGWQIVRFDLHDSPMIRSEIRFWNPIGCIIEFSTDNFAISPSTLRMVPTVLLDCNPSFARRGFAAVTQDTHAAGSAAADYLAALGLVSYAYVGWTEAKFWDAMREQAYLGRLGELGLSAAAIHPRVRISGVTKLRAFLADHLAGLAKPAGVYCVNDAMCAQVLAAADSLGLSVPDDLILLGTDNEVYICENTAPTLSSVEMDFIDAGRQAVDIIERLRAGEHPRKCHARFGVSRIVQRTSTRHTPGPYREVTAALDFIRANALSGLSAADVTARFGCSRRTAEHRFRRVTGHSILDEIHAVQIEHAKDLLRNRRTKTSVIPSLCGYRSHAFFMRLFHRETGLTMDAWRERQR